MIKLRNSKTGEVFYRPRYQVKFVDSLDKETEIFIDLEMPTKYINMTGRVENINSVRLPNDFTQSTIKDKYIVVKRVRLINNYSQLDIGCSLCEDFADEFQYSYGLIDDFIMC